ncbi:hypothetical protein MACJ_003738 [Theileria orientalis]|uniref:Kinetochore protein SPC25 n=1 Tax=Theileria orientalis TaxID=68886 RepID=A0A976SKB6_THEOR|nr:hypothetical protein MACJ_003738 [Theileria orientalis]
MNEGFILNTDFDTVLNLKNLKLRQFDFNKALDYIRKLNDKYTNDVIKTLDKKNSLQSSINDLTESTSNVLREIQINQISFNIINNDVTDVYNKIEESKNTLNGLRNEKARLENLLANKTEEYESCLRHKMLHDIWSIKLSYLQALLGITISNEDGSMKISFTRLSNSNPYRCCYIVLKLTDDKFTGISCEPKLKNFSKYISDLNNGLDFGSFLCLVRQSFKTTL